MHFSDGASIGLGPLQMYNVLAFGRVAPKLAAFMQKNPNPGYFSLLWETLKLFLWNAIPKPGEPAVTMPKGYDPQELEDAILKKRSKVKDSDESDEVSKSNDVP